MTFNMAASLIEYPEREWWYDVLILVRYVKTINIYGRMGVKYDDKYMRQIKIIEWVEMFRRRQTSSGDVDADDDDAC